MVSNLCQNDGRLTRVCISLCTKNKHSCLFCFSLTTFLFLKLLFASFCISIIHTLLRYFTIKASVFSKFSSKTYLKVLYKYFRVWTALSVNKSIVPTKSYSCLDIGDNNLTLPLSILIALVTLCEVIVILIY